MAARTFTISNEKGFNLGLLSCSMGLRSLEVILRDFCSSIVGAVPPTYWNLVRSRLQRVPYILQNMISEDATSLQRKEIGSERLNSDHVNVASEADVESVLRLLITDILERTPSASEPLGLQGLNSLSVLELRSLLEDRFGSNTFSNDELMGMTLETLMSSISRTVVRPRRQKQQQQETSILNISPCPILVKMRIFCLPWAGGLSENLFAHWGMLIPSCLQICPVEIPGRGRRSSESSIASISQLVGLLVNSLPFDDKPYAIFGTCLGGIVGYEMIQELRRQKKRLPVIFMPAAVSPPHVYSKVVMKIYTERSLSK